jgi:hypothetical protein
MMVDHLMCIKFVLWRKTMFNSTKSVILCLIIILLFILINFHLNFTIKFTYFENSTFIEYLKTSEMFFIWLKVDFCIYLIVPFIILSILNLYLFYKFKIKLNSENNMKIERLSFKYKMLNRLSFVILIIFTVFCAPGTIIGNIYTVDAANFSHKRLLCILHVTLVYVM